MSIVSFINRFMQDNNLSIREFSRMMGVSHPTVSAVLDGEEPSFDFCRKLATALNIPIDTVLIAAGLLPPKPEPDQDAQEFNLLFQSLPPDKRKAVLEFLRFQHSGAGVISPAPRVKRKIEH